MSNTISPNMSLIIPGVGSEAGPTYAEDINTSLSILDGHNHSPGSGVPITPSGININTALSLNTNFMTGIAGLTLVAQGSTPANNTIYESGVDLYYVDGNGNNVRITQSGGVAGSPGSIANLTSPASATYVSSTKTFVWQSNTSIAANLDAASVLLRNISPNSTFALTLSPPASLSNNYTITLPTVPASQSFMTIDNGGTIAAPVVYPLIASGIANNTITAAQIAPATITTAQISASAGILGSQLSASANIVGTQINAVTNINPNQLSSYDPSTAPFYATGTLSSNSLTTSSTYSHITALDCSLSLQSTARPTFITFIGSNASPGTIVISAPTGTGGQVQTVTFQIRAINGASSSVIATYAMTLNGTNQEYWPVSVLNTVDFFSLGNIYQVWVKTTTANTIPGSAGLFSTVIAQAFQV